MRTLSLVIPVLNAPDLVRTAVSAVPELARTAETCGFSLVETIFVDDGSAPPLKVESPGCRVIRVDMNAGKGAAALAPYADRAIACGSRRCGKDARPFHRRVLSRLFNAMTGTGLKDTQCGFKLFRMDVMRAMFERQKIARFAFDVELIRRVIALGGEVAEVPVEWKGGTRSSLRVLRDAPRMLWDLLRIALGH